MCNVYCVTWTEYHQVNVKASSRKEALAIVNKRYPDNDLNVVQWDDFEEEGYKFDKDGICDEYIPGATECR